ncbi:MAG: gliding motility-associated C-terminal domain-containing protein, partial [Flavobacteriales bacterium]|nr:gliding motility-associated C-terminal domain-containing protein [Flavobacteriales bacterium]
LSDYGSFNLQCVGDSSGVIELVPGGGTAPYSTQTTGPFGFVSNDPDMTALSAGAYQVQITDANGCQFDSLITLTEPVDQIQAALTAFTYPSGHNISCHGGSDGAIDASITGGVGPFIFEWRGPDSTQYFTEDISGLPAGDYAYELVVIDDNQCAFHTTISLTEPDTGLYLDILTSQYPGGVNLTCHASQDGAIQVEVHGGSPIYTYQWSGPGNSSTDPEVDGLQAGDHILTISDINGCVLQDTIALVAPDVLSPSIEAFLFPSGDAISCHSAADAQLSSELSGGTPVYTLFWTGPSGFTSTSPDIQDLGPGEYCLAVTDVNECAASTCFTVVEPAALGTGANISTAACGETNGSVDLTIMGGSAPYSIAWSNGAVQEDLQGLSAGPLSVSITDLNGCVALLDLDVPGTPAVIASATILNNLCAGSEEGAVDLEVTSGSAPFTFQWSNGANDEDLGSLSAGSYDVLITDANGCTLNSSFDITENDPITITEVISSYSGGYQISVHQGQDGAILVSPSGGVPPYQFAWSNGQAGPSVQNLSAGSYSVQVTDAVGCTEVFTFELIDPNDLVMPTAFSPNDDGANDLFIIQGIDAYPNNRFTVVNRWGNVVFEQLNYRNTWDGRNLQGEPLPDGTYFTILSVNGGATNQQRYVDLRR